MSRTSILGRIAVVAACLAVALLAVGPRPALADGAPPLVSELIKDIDATSAGSDPGPTVDVGGTAYTFGCSGRGDMGLWKSDGTAGGTTFIASVGPCDSTWIGATAVLGGKLYFVQLYAGAEELWVSDGTAKGTTWIAGADSDDLVAMGSTLYFFNNGRLIKSDGTRSGTSEVASLGDPAHLVNAGGKLFFAERNYGGLWKSDGTAGGTQRVPNAPYYVSQITGVGSRVFFSGSEDGRATDLWTSDGTKAGTRRVKDIDPTRADKVSNLVAVGTTLYFRARDASHGFELWKSNGLAAGTVMVKDIHSGSRGSGPADLINVSGTLFFTANDGRHGLRLWKSNGTTAATLPVSATVPTRDENGRAQQAAVGSSLFFSAAGAAGNELWRSNGTSVGTSLVMDINPTGDSFPRALALVGSRLFFSADDGLSGRELWVSNGTQTTMVADLNTATRSSAPNGLVRAGSSVFFAADDGVHGTELWKSDGTTSGTRMLKDINPGGANSLYEWTGVPMGSWVYFAADNGVRRGLWKSNGTVLGTKMISSVSPEQMIVLANRLIISDGRSLWKSDGTAAGTRRLRDFHVVGQGTGWIDSLTGAASRAYFVLRVESPGSYYPEEHSYLWRTDGTSAGTVRITSTDFEYDYGESPRSLITVGNTLFFVLGADLWKSDGTAAGTSVVMSFSEYQGYGYIDLQSLTAVGDQLFFTLEASNLDGNEGIMELWTSDGTSAGTITLGQFTHLPRWLTPVGASLFFSADGYNGPADLWMSDGTPQGTTNICCTQAASSLSAVGALVFMSASAGPKGSEPMYAIDWGSGPPWCPPTDVCPSGWSIELVGDLNPGAPGSHPSEFTQLGSKVLFVADDGSHGAELWSAQLP